MQNSQNESNYDFLAGGFDGMCDANYLYEDASFPFRFQPENWNGPIFCEEHNSTERGDEEEVQASVQENVSGDTVTSTKQLLQQQQQNQKTRMSAKQKALQRKINVQRRMNANVEEVNEEPQDKKQQQKIKNRISAQRSRDIKKSQFQELKEQVNELTSQVEILQLEKEELKIQLSNRICSRCRSENNRFEEEDIHSQDNEHVSYQRVQSSYNSRYTGMNYSPISALIMIGIILCLSMGIHSSIQGDNHNLEQTNQKPSFSSSNVLMLNELPKSVDEKCQCNTTHIQDQALSKLLSVYGMSEKQLNYGTQLIDSRTNTPNQLALKVYASDSSSEQETMTQDDDDSELNHSCLQDVPRKNDQIFCTDTTILLNDFSLPNDKMKPNKHIDVIYSTKHSKSFIQFGDQHFQTKADPTAQYVHLTCQVVSYYLGNLPETI